MNEQELNDYITRLVKLRDNEDTEAAHIAADDILCEILEELGFTDVVKEYSKIDKWYA